MEGDYEIIINKDGNTKQFYMTIKQKHKTVFQHLNLFINKIIQFVYSLFSKIVYFDKDEDVKYINPLWTESQDVRHISTSK